MRSAMRRAKACVSSCLQDCRRKLAWACGSRRQPEKPGYASGQWRTSLRSSAPSGYFAGWGGILRRAAADHPRRTTPRRGKSGTRRARRFARVVSKSPGKRPRQFYPATARRGDAEFPVLARGIHGNGESRWAEACSREARNAPPPQYTHFSVATRRHGVGR